MLKGLMKQYNPTFVRLNSDIGDQCIRRSWPWAQVRPLLIFYAHRRSKVTRYIMARNRMRSSGRHSNETTKSKERKDGRYAGRASRGGRGRGRGRQGKKRCAYGRVKKEDETSRCRRMACYDRVLFLSYESYQKRATRSPSARQGVARTLDHYRHCPLMDIYECTNQRHYYRASMQSESII